MAYAHSRNERGQRHDLVAHLRSVGNLTALFAEKLGAKAAGYWVGLWHDLGKFDPAWQDYLLACEGGEHRATVDHKAAGAKLAFDHPDAGPLSLLIQGHHGGLRSFADLKGWLADASARSGAVAALEAAKAQIPGLVPAEGVFALPRQILEEPLRAELFLRMLFSALIDADRLDTERHFDVRIAGARGAEVSLQVLWNRLEESQRQISGHRTDAVGAARHEIYEASLSAADLPPGFFRLSVPTGGGKTRSAMAFALRHALRYGHERVIVAIPYISITEQTARVYREIFESSTDSAPNVLEHHSGGSAPDSDDQAFDRRSLWQRLSAENWDSRIVVTTSVQLFESLFAAGTSATRKIHRLARSVVILDEAQTLPPYLLEPILDGLRTLVEDYGTTVVISTATQPAFDVVPGFNDIPATEIVPDPARHFRALRRVEYEWAQRPMEWREVADIVKQHAQTLVIVNTKRDALALLDSLQDPEAIHLSTLLCGAHRSDVLREVERRLAANLPCHLVSTQVVEAGVDLDFPLVLRALAPLDSVIQAAGRCNREGSLPTGRVIVFDPGDGGIPPGPYKTGRDVTRKMLGSAPLDPDDPNDARRYFHLWLQSLGDAATDLRNIQDGRRQLDYPRVARDFWMIEPSHSVVITRYGSDEQRAMVRRSIDELRAGSPRARFLHRSLQPYVVSIRQREAERLEREGLVAPFSERISEWLGPYDSVRGIAAGNFDPESLII